MSRPKRDFEIPLGRWFWGSLRHRIEAPRNPSPDLREYVHVGATRRLVFEHVIDRRDHSPMLWRLMVLECWLSVLKLGYLARPPSVTFAGL
jgi:hypothetical protein